MEAIKFLSEIALVISYCLVLLDFTMVRTIYISHDVFLIYYMQSVVFFAMLVCLSSQLQKISINVWDDILMSLYKAYVSVHPSIYWILPPANRLGI